MFCKEPLAFQSLYFPTYEHLLNNPDCQDRAGIIKTQTIWLATVLRQMSLSGDTFTLIALVQFCSNLALNCVYVHKQLFNLLK